MSSNSLESRPIDRVPLACVQCRSRHVKCDAVQPNCTRCKREAKECNYKKSRRGGLDKAALARRRLALQQQAERSQQVNQSTGDNLGHHSSTESSHSTEFEEQFEAIPRFNATSLLGSALPPSNNTMIFSVNTDRLLDLYFENFHPAHPVVLPLHCLSRRRMNENHGLQDLLLVLQWVGSLYAPWTPSEQYYEKAYRALRSPTLLRSCFSVQALMIFAIAQHNSDLKLEARITLDAAIAIALELGINSRDFAKQYGEGSPVLEESWRRTYYFLHLTDQHFAVVVNSPLFTMRDVLNSVDLPCDDEYYELELIPPPTTWQVYESRELADVEVIYSSLVYLFDICRVVSYIMRMFLATGTFSDALLASVDAKVAVWQSLLPACKKDPLQKNGNVDEVMFLAHMVCSVILMNAHRPFSMLVYSMEELTTQSFATPVPYIEPSRQGQCAHTARALKAADMHIKLLAIPCVLERHHPFTLCITASIATAQVSACNLLLEDHAASIARDRVRLSVGFLSTMGNSWLLSKRMAKEVRRVARRTLAGGQNNSLADTGTNSITEIHREDLFWPVGDPASQIDIYSGLVLPMNWDVPSGGRLPDR